MALARKHDDEREWLAILVRDSHLQLGGRNRRGLPRCSMRYLPAAKHGRVKQQSRNSTLFDFPGHRSEHGWPSEMGPIPLVQVQKTSLIVCELLANHQFGLGHGPSSEDRRCLLAQLRAC